MRLEVLLIFLCILSVKSHLSFEDAYGSLPSIGSMSSWAARNETGGSSGRDCTFPMDIIFIEDTGPSAADYLELLRNTQFSLVAETLTISHPGSRFGIVAYRDKPVWGFGSLDDFCQQIILPLTPWPIDLALVSPGFSIGQVQSSGRNQLGALVATAESEQSGWKEKSAAIRLAILSTRSWAHHADDGKNTYGMLPFSGHLNESQAQEQCTREYYPSVAQVKTSLETQQIYLGTLTHPTADNSQQQWDWLNSFLGQTPGFVQPLNNKFEESILKIVRTVETIECSSQPTPAPLDTPSTADHFQPATSAPPGTSPEMSNTPDSPTATGASVQTSTSTETSTSPATSPKTSTPVQGETVDTDAEIPGEKTTGTPSDGGVTTEDSKISASETDMASVTTATEVNNPSTGIESSTGATTAAGECQGNDEVIIRLKHRPKRLNLEVENDLLNTP